VDTLIEGVSFSQRKIIEGVKGDVLHVLKQSDVEFTSFGEAYFSIVNKGVIKGWKKHREMILNLSVPIGIVKFVLYDDRVDSPTSGQYFEKILSIKDYGILTVAPGIWVAFQGLDEDNLLLNIASIEHSPDEADTMDVSAIKYIWE